MKLIEDLPDRGWGVLRCPLPAVLVLHGAGLAHVHVTATRDVWMVRLTAAGRRYRKVHR